MNKKPKYLEIKDEIKSQILNKKYNVGDKISSERELAVFYNVTRVTVQKSMNALEQEGFIESEKEVIIRRNSLNHLRKRFHHPKHCRQKIILIK